VLQLCFLSRFLLLHVFFFFLQLTPASIPVYQLDGSFNNVVSANIGNTDDCVFDGGSTIYFRQGGSISSFNTALYLNSSNVVTLGLPANSLFTGSAVTGSCYIPSENAIYYVFNALAVIERVALNDLSVTTIDTSSVSVNGIVGCVW
jgi:hypothetical protein